MHETCCPRPHLSPLFSRLTAGYCLSCLAASFRCCSSPAAPDSGIHPHSMTSSCTFVRCPVCAPAQAAEPIGSLVACRRNELVALDLIVGAVMAMFAFVSMIAGVFGMNLKNGWEESMVSANMHENCMGEDHGAHAPKKWMGGEHGVHAYAWKLDGR